MNPKRRIKRTTLLIIGAILLWCSVALWNELEQSEGVSTPSQTASHTPQPEPLALVAPR